MGAQRSSFGKLQRDRAKKEKAALKRERRQERLEGGDDVTPEETPPLVGDHGGPLSASELLELIDLVHQQFDAGTIDYDTFEEKKAELLARLPID